MIDVNIPNEDEISLTYICCICKLILKEPVRLICGHRYCQSCVNNQTETMIQCRRCEEITPKNEVLIDEVFKSNMERLNVICRLCNWTDIWKNYQNHLYENHSDLLCDSCNQICDSTNDLDQHKNFSCQNRMICCKLLSYGCNEQFLRKDFVKHCFTEKHQNLLIQKIFQKKPSSDRSIKSQILTKIQQINEQITDLSKKYRSINDCVQRMNDLTSIQKK